MHPAAGLGSRWCVCLATATPGVWAPCGSAPFKVLQPARPDRGRHQRGRSGLPPGGGCISGGFGERRGGACVRVSPLSSRVVFVPLPPPAMPAEPQRGLASHTTRGPLAYCSTADGSSAVVPRNVSPCTQWRFCGVFALSRDSSWRAILRNSVITAARHLAWQRDGKTLRSLKS